MPSKPSDTPSYARPDGAANQQKARTGLVRLWHAATYSASGLRTAWLETTFQQEVLAALVMLPAAFWVGSNWVEISLLIVTVVIVLVVELLNTAVEITIDRISPEWHELSKLAKDVSSAAVLLVLLLCGGIWLAAIYHRFF